MGVLRGTHIFCSRGEILVFSLFFATFVEQKPTRKHE